MLLCFAIITIMIILLYYQFALTKSQHHWPDLFVAGKSGKILWRQFEIVLPHPGISDSLIMCDHIQSLGKTKARVFLDARQDDGLAPQAKRGWVTVDPSLWEFRISQHPRITTQQWLNGFLPATSKKRLQDLWLDKCPGVNHKLNHKLRRELVIQSFLMAISVLIIHVTD